MDNIAIPSLTSFTGKQIRGEQKHVGKSGKQSSQFASNEKDFWILLRKNVEFLAGTGAALVVTMVEEEAGDMGKGSLAAASLSSSLIVSSIFDVLCLMTLIYCGGAASVMNFAMREFAILFKYLGGEKRK